MGNEMDKDLLNRRDAASVLKTEVELKKAIIDLAQAKPLYTLRYIDTIVKAFATLLAGGIAAFEIIKRIGEI